MATLFAIHNTGNPSSKRPLRSVGLFVLLHSFCLTPLFAQWQVPLSQSEIALVREQTMSHRAQQRKLRANKTQHSAQHKLGLEIVLIELKEQKAESSLNRTAQVFLYDYNTGLSSLEERDAVSGKLLNTFVIDSPFLPLTQNEIEYTKSLLNSNQALLQSLQVEHQKQFQSQLLNMDNVEMKVAIWQPLIINSALSRTCAKQRCAMVSMFTINHFSYSVEPVVNLMDATVVFNEFSTK